MDTYCEFEIFKGRGVIDSRDLIAERDRLTAEIASAREEEGDAFAPEGWEEEADRIAEIDKVLEDLGDEVTFGMIMVEESSFEDYARGLAEDIGAIDRTLAWPACHIDWSAAAESLAMDYTSVDFDGVTWLCR